MRVCIECLRLSSDNGFTLPLSLYDELYGSKAVAVSEAPHVHKLIESTIQIASSSVDGVPWSMPTRPRVSLSVQRAGHPSVRQAELGGHAGGLPHDKRCRGVA